MQKAYHRKVKMIYIDPPYNTGNDFIYKDDFRDNVRNFKEKTKQDMMARPANSGRYHSDWLNMMYTRLRLARNLLSDDGAVFISIDDNEESNLRHICNQIFGEENFIGNFIWRKKSTSTNVTNAIISSQTDYIVTYSKSELPCLNRRVTSVNDRVYPFSDKEGNYRTAIIEKKDAGDYARETMKFEILGTRPRDGKRWQIGEKKARAYEQEGRFIIDNGIVKLKIYEFQDEDSFSANPNLLLDFGTTDTASKMVNNSLFGIPELFPNPKPIELLKHLIDMGTKKDSIVLDFFSGSATTAHATMQLNIEDNSRRTFIMVQLPELCDEKSEAYIAGYNNICEIGKERIRRAGEKIKEENQDKEGIENLDTGFKVFKLDTSNLKAWDPNVEELEETLKGMVDPIKEDRTQEDMLYEIMLKYGIDLTMPLEEIQIKGKTAYSVGLGYMIVCLEDGLTLDVIEAIGNMKQSGQEIARVVFRDSGFADDNVKTNAVQLLKKFGIEDFRTI